MDFMLRHLKKPAPVQASPVTGSFNPDAKHETMRRAIAPYAKTAVPQAPTRDEGNLDYVTKKTKLLLVLMPEWSAFFPPFNLARLSAMARSNGFQTRIMDVNIRGYKHYRDVLEPKNTFDFPLWSAVSIWRWIGEENYMTMLHPHFEEILEQALAEILEYNPDVIGFSEYFTNEESTNWMARELRKRAPHIKLAVGGSNIQNGWHKPKPYFDWVVNGEGEQTILKILEDVERGISPESTQHIMQPEDQRLSINDLPLPDYTGIDFNDYEMPNGVNSELSRGCTAKCTFCEETHFYKYRQRNHTDALREIEYLHKEKGTDVIWFIDSLVNGSLKELRAFCRGIIERGLKIKWTGYCRCDGRMDRAFYQDLADSGCVMLNYGIESGSQRVLNDMNKGVTIEEMEQNFRDGKETGVWAATNWIIGFPTEKYQDFADTMTFLARNIHMNINNIGAGVGFSLGMETVIGQNIDKYNLLPHHYMGHWITKDFKLGGPHILIRVKSFAMFLDHLDRAAGCLYPFRPNLQKHHYKIAFDDPEFRRDVEYENFDYNIIKPEINPLADSVVNEIWPILRMLWKTRGGFTAKILFKPELDLKEFGTAYGPGGFNAEYNFSIDHDGRWSAHFKFDFEQMTPENDHREPEFRGPFMAQDYSWIKSPSATRARRIAKPSWGEDGRNQKQFENLVNDEILHNQTVDFTFNYEWQGHGEWTLASNHSSRSLSESSLTGSTSLGSDASALAMVR